MPLPSSIGKPSIEPSACSEEVLAEKTVERVEESGVLRMQIFRRTGWRARREAVIDVRIAAGAQWAYWHC
jgi:hypothetical protein